MILLPQILLAIPKVEVGVESLIAWVQSLRTAAQQSGDWTAEQEAAFLESLIARRTDRAYLPDAALK